MSESELSIIDDPEQEAKAAKYRLALEGQGMDDVSEGGGWGDMDEVDDDKVAQILAQKKIDDALADEFERRDAMDFIQELDPDNPSYIQDEPEPMAPVRVKGEGGPMAQLRALRQKLQEEYRKEKGSPEFNFEMPIAKMPAYGFGPQEVGMQAGADFADMGTGMDFNFEERGMMAKPTTRTVGLEFHGQHAHSGTQTLHAAIGRSQTQYFALDPVAPAPISVPRSISRGGGRVPLNAGIYEYKAMYNDYIYMDFVAGAAESSLTGARYCLVYPFAITNACTLLAQMYQQFRITAVEITVQCKSISPRTLKDETTYDIYPCGVPTLAIVINAEGPGYFTGRSMTSNSVYKVCGQRGAKTQTLSFRDPKPLTLRQKALSQQNGWYDTSIAMVNQLATDKYCPWIQYAGNVIGAYVANASFKYNLTCKLTTQWRSLKLE